jgi:hypothetical protein
MDKTHVTPAEVTKTPILSKEKPKAPVTPTDVAKVLDNHFEGIKETAISHVVSNGEGDNLYVVLMHVKDKSSAAAASGKAELSTDGKVDELDRSLSGQLTNLFGHVVAFDGCDVDPTKPHCAGSSDGFRHRGKDGEPKVPGERVHKAAKGPKQGIPHDFVSTEVPANKVQPIFDTMARIGDLGVGK